MQSQSRKYALNSALENVLDSFAKLQSDESTPREVVEQKELAVLRQEIERLDVTPQELVSTLTAICTRDTDIVDAKADRLNAKDEAELLR